MKTIGIDPDFDKSGVCILDEGGAIVSLESVSMCDLIDDMRIIYAHGGYVFALEDVSKSGAIYGKYGKNEHYKKVARAKSVGKVQAAHQIIRNMILHIGCEVVDVPAGVGKQVKKDAKLFKRITGYTKQTNEDKRDAWAIATWCQHAQKNR